MSLILLVLSDPDRLEDLLIAWEENGVQAPLSSLALVLVVSENYKYQIQ